MSRFLVLNFQDFGLNHNITKTIQSHTLFCICCLEKNVPFLCLANCKHAKFLDLFTKPKMRHIREVVCYNCHDMMKKFEAFRQQVQESFTLLESEEFDITNTNNVRYLNFETKKAVNIYLPPVKRNMTITENDQKTLTCSNKEQSIQDPKGKQQVTIEIEIETELEPETLNEIDVDKKLVGKNVKKIKKELVDIEISPVEANVSNDADTVIDVEMQHLKKKPNIELITLTKSELIHERLQLAQTQEYLKHPYRCEHCLLGFNYEANIKDHMERKHAAKANSTTCEICLQVVCPATSISAHNYRHFTRHQCVTCGNRYIDFDDALRHYRDTHQKCETVYKCRHCDFITAKLNLLSLHKLKHERFVCRDCGLVVTTGASLKRHMFLAHKKTIFKCVQCKITFETEKCYASHMSTHGASAHCAPCNIAFKSWHSYNTHLTLSSAHAPRTDRYKCEDCGMKFGAPAHLRIHAQMRHARTTVHQCPHCSKVFTLAVELKQHVQKLHNENLTANYIVCDYCGRAYKTRVHLIRHMKLAHGNNKKKKIKTAVKKKTKTKV